jgi:predicted amidophosphoribosyltransferase
MLQLIQDTVTKKWYHTCPECNADQTFVYETPGFCTKCRMPIDRVSVLVDDFHGRQQLRENRAFFHKTGMIEDVW